MKSIIRIPKILPVWKEPEDINEAKIFILDLGQNIHEHVYLVGKYLIWIKEKVGYGNFENWINENIWFGDRTAQRFIAFSKKCEYQNKLLEYHPRKLKVKTDTVSVLGIGEFRTLVIDPPWPVEKVERYERPYQEPYIGYPTMTIDAIKAMGLPFAEECHIYLWTTQKFLPFAFEVFETWQVKYIQTLVWHKNVGFTPFGLFMNNVEFALFGRKGSLSLIKAGEKLCFESKGREHSRKPDEFYNLVRKVSPEPRIDIFSREKRDGFDQWGNEIDRFKD